MPEDRAPGTPPPGLVIDAETRSESRLMPTKRRLNLRVEVLRVDVRALGIPRSIPRDQVQPVIREEVRHALIKSVLTDHRLPSWLEVRIYWGNYGTADKFGDWQEVLDDSAGGHRSASSGFDRAMLGFLERYF